MSEIRTRCQQGWLIVNDRYVRVELRSMQRSLSRSTLTGIDSAMVVPNIFGITGVTNLIFHGQGGERLHAHYVKTNIAREIKSMLGF